MKSSDILRAQSLAKQMVKQFELDLKGIKVLTECATGAYTFTPIIAALAGAEVWAFGKDSSYGSFRTSSQNLTEQAQKLGVNDRIQCISDLSLIPPNTIDLVTNSGALRPITATVLDTLKASGVLALMWETWEFRQEELDLQLCLDRGIPVIGTNEVGPLLDMSPYPGLLALKLLMSLGVEPIKSTIALIGGSLTGSLIANFFQQISQPFHWFADDPHGLPLAHSPYQDLYSMAQIQPLDAVICAEHASSQLIAGDEAAPLSFQQLATSHPALRWGHLSGHIDVHALERSGLYYFPSTIQPPKVMTYNTWELGIRPVLELHTAGLKVGEVACRSRLRGASPQEAINAAVSAGIGQDWEGSIFSQI